MQQKESGIYLITCRITSKRYIGSSKDVWYRWRSHKKDLKRQCHKNRYLQRAWNKYGVDTFDCVIIEHVEDESQLLTREQHWLDLLKPEYNLAPKADKPIGMRGKKQSPEARQKSSESNKRYWESLSDKEKEERRVKSTHLHTEEAKKKMSEGVRKAYQEGRWATPESISEGLKKASERGTYVRKPLSKESRQKISQALKKHFEPVKAQTAAKRAEWEQGREQREMERRRKLSAANTGKPVAEETKAKLRAAATAQMADHDMQEKHRQAVKEAMQRPEVKEALAKRPKPQYTDEHRQKIGEAHLGRKNSPETIELMKQKRREWWAKKKAEQLATK